MYGPSGKQSLSTLTTWSMDHIRDIFEAASDEESTAAVEATFSAHLKASINGAAIDKEDIKKMVLAMRTSSKNGLTVVWKHAVDAPLDPSTCRDGSFGGVYIIQGVYKQWPGHDTPEEFERHKTVTVKIQSESSNLEIDSRKIVELAFVASDIKKGPPGL